MITIENRNDHGPLCYSEANEGSTNDPYVFDLNGAPGKIRTPNLLIRSEDI